MIYPLSRIIRELSGVWALKASDLIFTGTPAGVGPVFSGDVLRVESPQLASAEWRFVAAV